MIVLRIVLFAGVAAVIVGVVGLLAPVSASPENRTIECGSAVAPDLSAARAHDDGSAANIPVPGGVVADTDFTRLCQMNLEDRRIWTITLAVAGLVAVAGALVLGARWKRGARST
ncbi:hypothetical protein [Mycobacterium sp. IS-3022]|uniref:hypothetical protein n=1 Tax=Mycobacterium sp. IS-3022 TaxID=1772277 RepID=UPI00074166EE|nr:hypothetical protein [Mycobacterium sp. IS-3022]KUH99192.1 hypothetical protein AU188_10980 [Mycobacterium sp. IS-3022]